MSGELWIEAESFESLGGWMIDSQSMEVLHSAYLMAHGLGVPVADATTPFSVWEAGRYHIWALTRDWTAVWQVKDPAGRFALGVDGTFLPSVLGTKGEAWSWQKAGEISLSRGKHTLSLHDLTGLNGRVDAIYLTQSEKTPSDDREEIEEMRRRLNWKSVEEDPTEYDLIVVGGGIAGICTALAASRTGSRVLLLHDRGVLGGCNSSEVRVCVGGQIHLPPYPNLGNVVKEITPVMGSPRHFDAAYYEDNRKLFAFENLVKDQIPCELAFFWSLTEADYDPETKRIRSVVCTDVKTGKKKRYHGALFSDCSGDAILARLCHCETMYGRESRQTFGETLAPIEAQSLVMGHSLRWYSEETKEPSAFPDLDWNMGFTDETCLHVTSGDWEQETGFERDMIRNTEYIRDYGLRAILSNWSYQKNRDADRLAYANHRLVWVSGLGGKRESCRVVGDYILTQHDIDRETSYDDGTACMTWSIDMHFPECDNQKQFEEPFRSFAYHRGIVTPCPVPYRCLCARDVDNLFLGGRIVSTSHVAFSSVRVMRTLGELGEVAGLAASLCRRFDCSPHELWIRHAGEMKEAMTAGVPSPDAFAYYAGREEGYHFKDVGWIFLNNYRKPESRAALEKFRRGIAALGIEHKYPLPDELNPEIPLPDELNPEIPLPDEPNPEIPLPDELIPESPLPGDKAQDAPAHSDAT